MLNSGNHIFLIDFHFSSRKGEVIVSSTFDSLNQLVELIKEKREKHAFTGMDIYELQGLKLKKTSLKHFRAITNFHTDLDVLLSDIYV